MSVLVIKSLVTGIWAFAFYLLCRTLQVPPIYLTALAAWGAFCFLFSFELAGHRKRVRNGLEQKTLLQLAWMGAGIVCVLTAFLVLFRWS